MLKNGLKFVPDPRKFDKDQFITDTENFAKKLKTYFYLGETKLQDKNFRDNMFSNPSRWVPPEPEDPVIQSVVKGIKLNGENPSFNKNFRPNMCPEMYESLDNLKNNPQIVIKDADKGGATIIMAKDEYHLKMEEILSDEGTYININLNEMPLNKLMAKVKRFVKSHETYFTEKEIDYLCNFEPSLAYIYGKPKIHKCQKLQQLVSCGSHTHNNVLNYRLNELNISMRPIVSGRRCPVSRLCELAKLLLAPFEKLIPHLIIDSFDFLRRLPKVITGTDICMIAIDIEKLYPSISNELGQEALNFWLEEYKNSFIKDFDTKFTIDLVRFIQDNVYLTFNEKLYRQRQGTAMGKNHAPPYANLTIAYLIIKRLYPRLETRFGVAVRAHIEQNIFIYLDDGFILLDQHILHPDTLIKMLNELDSNIKFTYEKSNVQIAFLDILIKIEKTTLSKINGLHSYDISTDIFHKETDAFNYLPFNSSAPRHIKRNIPYTLARRIAAIVSDNTIQIKRYHDLKIRLINKKYPLELINDGISKAQSMERSNLLTKNQRKNTENTVSLVFDYNPKIVDPAQKVRELSTNLQYVNKVKIGKRKEPNIIVARRQPLNLLRILTLSKVRDQNIQHFNDFNFSKCRDKRCETCEIVIKEQKYTTKNGYTLRRNFKFTCKSRDFIYVIVCGGCSREYVGETGSKLNIRMNLHRNQIQHEKYANLKCSKHIKTCGKTNFKVFPFYKCFKQCHKLRETLETKFRNLIKPELH